MRTGLYIGLAKDGIRKNRKLYVPFLLTVVGMIMMFYIIDFLSVNKTVTGIHGGSNVQLILSLGSGVIAVFAVIFLFYTNSFLIRRRKKEFGLYNILGLGRIHIACILFWENVLAYFLTMVIGLSAGILFSKLAQLGLLLAIGEEVSYDFSLSLGTMKKCVLLFGFIFILLYLSELFQIRKASAISLLRSETEGEKAPKANWFLAILGVILLGSAYIISLSIQDALQAIELFFFAVILVILGTYALMIAGSVAFCKLLQKNRNYYYQKKHFVSVASMVYRMKRNGAGLASICILATMILVMLSSTSCLFFGSEDALKHRYPRQLNIEFQLTDADALETEKITALTESLRELARQCGQEPVNEYSCRKIYFQAVRSENRIEMDIDSYYERFLGSMQNLIAITIVPMEDYEMAAKSGIRLKENETILYSSYGTYGYDEIHFGNEYTLKVVKELSAAENLLNTEINPVPTIYLYVSNPEAVNQKLEKMRQSQNLAEMSYLYEYRFDTALPEEKQLRYDEFYQKKLKTQLDENKIIQGKLLNCYLDSRALNRYDFRVTFGGLFYLGILLSIVFSLAAVLIIYYKQVSEGFEDQKGFEIMQKVGMTEGEIRSSINSQMLTIFFYPLILAGIHVCFAFPVIQKMLLCFSLDNVRLFVMTSLICFAVFGILYLAVYRLTSNAYFKLVRGMQHER